MTTPPLTNPLLNPAHLAALAQQAQQTAPAAIRPPSDAGSPPTIGNVPSMTSPPPQLPSPTMPNVTRIPSQLDTEKAELARKVNTGSGISQIMGKVEGAMPNHPLVGKLLGGAAQGLATLGDVGLRAVAPAVDLALPGTSLHHLADLHQGNKQVAADELNAEKEAQTKNLELEPQLNLAKQALANQKQEEVAHQHQAVNENNAAKLKSTLAAHGFAQDEENEGQLRPLKYEEMSETQQAVHDLKGAQEEQAKATADLKKAQNDPSSPTYQMAQARLQSAQNAHSIALQRLGLSERQFEMRAHGTENGTPLPGSIQTDQGTVGTAFQKNVAPTETEKNASGRAVTMNDLSARIREGLKDPEIQAHLGPVAGRAAQLQGQLGTLPPKVAEFYNDLKSYGAFQAGLHPVRGIGGLQYFDRIMGGLAQTPEQLEGKLTSNERTAGSVQKVGSPKVAGGNTSVTGGQGIQPSGKAVSLKDAMALPVNKGKSEADVRKDIESHGHTVNP